MCAVFFALPASSFAEDVKQPRLVRPLNQPWVRQPVRAHGWKSANRGYQLKAIDAEIARLEETDLYQLKTQVDQAEEEERDLLAAMAAGVDQQVAEARGRLRRSI